MSEGGRLRSGLCTEESLTSPRFRVWADRLRPAWDRAHTGIPIPMHRKVWEWVFIAEALHERGVLGQGSRGLGFGVGRDPLASLFASLGCEVVATDIDRATAIRRGWSVTGQYAGDLGILNEDGICEPETFARRVSFRVVDMNRIPADLGDFDFAWSACAFEHLGSIALGQEFILAQMDCLRDGGVSVHTTEFNVFSNHDTIATGETVLFRRHDIEWLTRALARDGHSVDVDFNAGYSQIDRYVDVPPWSGPHIKLQVGEHVSTSLGLIIEKAQLPGRERRLGRAIRRGFARRSPAAVQQLAALQRARRNASPGDDDRSSDLSHGWRADIPAAHKVELLSRVHSELGVLRTQESFACTLTRG